LKLNIKGKFKCSEMKLNKTNQLKKVTIKTIDTKLDIKFQWKEMFKDGIEEKQIN
jgi:hypothetical protein